MKSIKYGWKRDTVDRRDIPYQKPKVLKPLPDAIDLREYCSPVEDQADLGSCTAQAIVGNLEILEAIQKMDFVDLSRLFVYYQERYLEGNTEKDEGAMLRTGMRVLKHYGVCAEKTWPYDITRYAECPPQEAYDEARKHTTTRYLKLKSVEDMLYCLADGFPFVFGFLVFPSLHDGRAAETGEASMPLPNEEPLGGHAVCAVGYDLPHKKFLVRNSWGTDWGRKGYFELPFEYFTEGLADDCWTIRVYR